MISGVVYVVAPNFSIRQGVRVLQATRCHSLCQFHLPVGQDRVRPCQCAPQQLTRAERTYVQELYMKNFEQLENLRGRAHAMLVHASHNSNNLPMLQSKHPTFRPLTSCPCFRILTSYVQNLLLSDAAPVAPPSLLATLIWFQNNPETDF